MSNKYLDIIETLWLTEQLSVYPEGCITENSIEKIVNLTPFIVLGLHNEITEATDQVEERLHFINDIQNAINVIDDRMADWGGF